MMPIKKRYVHSSKNVLKMHSKKSLMKRLTSGVLNPHSMIFRPRKTTLHAQLIPKYLEESPIKKGPTVRVGPVKLFQLFKGLLHDVVAAFSDRAAFRTPRVGSSLFARSCRSQRRTSFRRGFHDRSNRWS